LPPPRRQTATVQPRKFRGHREFRWCQHAAHFCRTADIGAVHHHELAEGGIAWERAGEWLQTNLTHRVVAEGAVLAWFDSVSTAIEGALLLIGSSWAEWIVAIGLACLLPIEALSIEHRPGLGKLVVLLANAVIVVYLVRRRTSARANAIPTAVDEPPELRS
jgi:uncharacterized membrane protein (DUF2068 family)